MDDTHRSTVFILIAGIGLIGLTPVLAVAAWLTRGRSRPDEAPGGGVRRGAAIGALVALVAVVLGTAWYLSGRAQPAPEPDMAAGGSMAMDGSTTAGGAAPMGGSAAMEHSSVVLPERLSGLPLSWSASGSEALRQVASMHSGSFRLAWAEIGTYGSAGDVQVWVAAPADGTAAQMANLMAERISEGSSPFETPRLDRGVWTTTGLGKVHLFWATDEAVWWVSADRDLAGEALQQLRGKVATG